MPKIVRRVGASPAARGSLSGQSCPEWLELDSGDFRFVGTRVTDTADTAAWLADHEGGIAPHEGVIDVPRDLVLAAAQQIVNESRKEHDE